MFGVNEKNNHPTYLPPLPKGGGTSPGGAYSKEGLGDWDGHPDVCALLCSPHTKASKRRVGVYCSLTSAGPHAHSAGVAKQGVVLTDLQSNSHFVIVNNPSLSSSALRKPKRECTLSSSCFPLPLLLLVFPQPCPVVTLPRLLLLAARMAQLRPRHV